MGTSTKLVVALWRIGGSGRGFTTADTLFISLNTHFIFLLALNLNTRNNANGEY